MFLVFLRSQEARERKAEREARKFIRFDKARVIQVKLEHPEGQIHFEWIDDGWHVTHPIESKADKKMVELFLDNLGDTTHDVDPVGEGIEEFPRFGLDNPSLVIRFRESESEERSVAFGNQVPAGGKFYYATRDGEASIHLVRDFMFKRLDRDLYTLRDKTILDLDPDAVHVIHAVGGR